MQRSVVIGLQGTCLGSFTFHQRPVDTGSYAIRMWQSGRGMNTLSQILLQLREADKYASAKNPHLRRLAVVLLDNIIELQLRRKVETELMFDRTTWHSGARRHNQRQRQTVFRRHPDLVDFATQLGWMTKDNATLLSYAHQIRNAFYHEGDYDDLDGEIAVRLLYEFVRTFFPKWRTARPFLFISPQLPIEVEAARDDPTGSAPILAGFAQSGDNVFARSHSLKSEDYWQRMLNHGCLAFGEFRIRFVGEAR